MTMNTGERQVAPTLDGIRRDHVARYEFAARILPPASRVIDFACGIGYGSAIMAEAGHSVRGYDIEDRALEYGRLHYRNPNAIFARVDGNAPGELGDADAAVCFETIEHIEDPRPLLKALRLSASTLVASVPNEEVMPWSPAPGVGTRFHFRHYTKFQFAELLRSCGWCAVEWHGQLGPESEVEPDANGRTIIAVCQRDELPAEEDDPELRGKHIAILGLGPSLEQYVDLTKRLGGRSRFCDEVWAINALGNVLDCDLIFHMDDVRVQEIRAAAAPSSNIASLVKWLKTSRTPVMTSRKHPDYPALVEFPLEDVLNHFGYDYFNSTAAYAVAFAIHAGAKKISLFGVDFSYANSHEAEKGRACVEFWLGYAQANGVKVSLPTSTTLMDACHTRQERLYGYDGVDVKFDIQADGQVRLDFVPREALPTAEEMEARYDHTAHPNVLVERAAASAGEVA